MQEILETQFEKNPQFRTVIATQTGTELRSHPVGKDKLGNAYWSSLDDQCNLRIYQEHLDENIWKVVATNRDDLVKLIAYLKGNELVMPSLVGLVDEDSSSNSMPAKVDVLNETASVKAEIKIEADSVQTEAEAPKSESSLNIKIKLKPGGSGEAEVKTETVEDETQSKSDATDNPSAETVNRKRRLFV